MAAPAVQYRWARLAPYNLKEGNLVRRFVHRSVVYRGGETPMWYKVPLALAVELAEFFQREHDPRTPPLFQIFDDAGRKAMDEHENRLRLLKLGVIAQQEVPLSATPVAMDLTSAGVDGKGVPVSLPAPGRAFAIPQGPVPMTPAALQAASQAPQVPVPTPPPPAPVAAAPAVPGAPVPLAITPPPGWGPTPAGPPEGPPGALGNHE